MAESDEEKNRQKDGYSSGNEDETGVLPSRNTRPTYNREPPVQSEFQIPASPPSFVTMRQLTEAAHAFYNMSLAHEITVDSEFRVERYDPPEDSFEHVVKETMHRAFWDILRSSLEADPPDYKPALRLLTEIKQSLNGLVLPNQKTLQKLIDSSLDLEVAKTALETTGRLNLSSYAIQVINLMRQFCAPVRDQEVEALRKIDDPVEAFRNAFILLEKMHMDLANFTIAQMRPYIRQQAVQYERSKFTSFLEAQQVLGLDGLRRTRDWIKAAFNKLMAIPRSEPPSTGSNPIARSPTRLPANRTISGDSASSMEEIPLTPNNILREAYLELLNWQNARDWPETVLMDQQRLTELGIQLSNIVTVTSLVLVVCNYVASNASSIFSGSFLSHADPSIMVRLKQLVCQAGVDVLRKSIASSVHPRAKAMSEEICFTIERWLNTVNPPQEPATSPNIAGQTNDETESVKHFQLLADNLKQTLVSQVNEVVYERHPVFVLMNKRALGFLRSALSSHPPEPLPLPPGFSILSDVTQFSDDAVQDDRPGCSTAVTTKNPTSQAVPSTMATGRRPRSPETEPTKRLQKLEHLSLSNLASRLMPLLAHNRHVFGPYYAEIIQALLLPNTPRPTSPLSAMATFTRRPVSRANSAPRSEPEEETFEMN